MSNLEKYLDRVIVQKSANSQAPRAPGGDDWGHFDPPAQRPPDSVPDEPMTSITSAIRRRWYIVLLTFLVLCAAGIPAIWLLIQKSYVVNAAIRVDPIIPNILTGEEGGMSNYTSFMTTQAMMVTSPQVVSKVATDLSNKGLQFFEIRTDTLAVKLARRLGRKDIKPDPEKVLRDSILDELITARPLQRGEHIIVSMTWPNANESIRIVDSFIREYMALEGTSASNKEEGTLATLEEEKSGLELKLDDYQKQIKSMADEFGTKKLAGRYDMKMMVVGKLLTELMTAKARRIAIQAQVKFREDEQTKDEPVSLEEWVRLREEYVNNDSGVKARTTNVIVLEQGLIDARQNLAPGNPQIQQKEELLASLRTSLDEEKEKARAEFNELLENERISEDKKLLTDQKKALEQAQAHEDWIQAEVNKEDAETIDLGTKNLAILDLEDHLALAKGMYDTILRRIQEVKMERKRPARIYVDTNAHIGQVLDKRAKYTAALVLGSVACGMLLAFLREKADLSFRTPDDVARRSGLRIIGTTTSTNTVRPASLRDQVAGDYQTIRANLGMLEGGGMPKTLVVTSPEMKEGKTTFAVNLAISVSKSGKKVLLIDGDMRNPCIASLLGLPKGSRGLQDVLLGKKALHDALYSVPSSRLDIIAADSSNAEGVFELLASSVTVQRLSEIGQGYDHVIIDTPPVLAFADALIWARVADGVILTCFAGLTTSPNLKKAKERLARINANVLGTVVSNVEVDDSYHPYGYGYYSRGGHSRAHAKLIRSKMLLPMNTPKPKVDKS